MNAFGYADHDGILLFKEAPALLNERVDVEIKLRKIDGVRTRAVFALCQCGCTGKPAGISSHDFNNGDLTVLVAHRPAVTDDFLDGSTDVLGS